MTSRTRASSCSSRSCCAGSRVASTAPATLRDQIINLGRGFAQFLAARTAGASRCWYWPRRTNLTMAHLARPRRLRLDVGHARRQPSGAGILFRRHRHQGAGLLHRPASHLRMDVVAAIAGCLHRLRRLSVSEVPILHVVLMRDPLTLENNILTPFVRPDAESIAKDQSQLLSYAWSLGSGTAPDDPSDSFADVWKTTEWQVASRLRRGDRASPHVGVRAPAVGIPRSGAWRCVSLDDRR